MEFSGVSIFLEYAKNENSPSSSNLRISPNSNSFRSMVDEEALCGFATTEALFSLSLLECIYWLCLGYMVQLVEVQQLRGAVGGDMFCCLLTEEPPSKKESKFSFRCNSRGYAFRGENQCFCRNAFSDS